MLLAFSIRGPSQARINCTDNEDGSADVTYYPLADGEYAVHVLFDGEDVSGSPFMANIQPSRGNFNPLKVGLFQLSVNYNYNPWKVFSSNLLWSSMN